MNILWIYSDVCQIPAVLKLILFIKTIMKYVCLLVPIGLIVMTSIDIGKSAISSDEQTMRKNFSIGMKRIMYCMFIFLVPSITTLVVNLANDSISNLNVNVSSCEDNLDNIAYFEQVEAAKFKEEEEKQNQRIASLISGKAKDSVKKRAATTLSGSSGGNSGSGGNIAGQKYILRDAQLKGLAMLSQKEQGSPVGAAAEASLIANRFEIYGSACGTGGDGLYNYVLNTNYCASQNGSWWGSNVGAVMQDTSGLDEAVLASVKEVLVLGKRTLPLYIDEHDCIYCGANYGFDITSIVTDGQQITSNDPARLKDHSNYKQDKTRIFNRYYAEYTFYSFPTEQSDPFGYTDDAKNARGNSN